MGKLVYRLKAGTHTPRRGREVMKPGDTIEVNHPSELGIISKCASFPEKWELVRGTPESPPANVPKPTKSLKLQHRGGPWWDVVNEEGVKVNDTALRKEDAEKMARGAEGKVIEASATDSLNTDDAAV